MRSEGAARRRGPARAIRRGRCSIMGAPSARDAGNRMTVVCEPCGRRGRYNVERLIAKHGDAKILYLLAEITACPKTQSTNIYDRCKAKYEGLTTR
jgi:hypothetical protein